MKTYKGLITKLPDNGIIVFGANTQGRHGAGTAKIALDKFGAIYGQASGLQGQSYSIITKDLTKDIHPSISPTEIITQIDRLYEFAVGNPDKLFFVAYTGSGKNLNGYSPDDMAMMFRQENGIPDNVVFEEEFAKLINQ